MNKNPFVPQPSYSHQPPLPPGPPPQPAQPDYSAYWAAAAAAQQHQQHPAAAPAYNPQWSAPQQPPRPPEQHALYANYGYGSQHNSQWQRVQHQQPYQQPPPPAAQPPPPPTAQPAYNPYQPAAAYPQPYVPQSMPQAIPPQPPYQPQIPAPQQPYVPRPSMPPHHQQQRIPQQHPPPQHQHQPQHHHPAKRQRFDGPSQSSQYRQPSGSQGQFQPIPPGQSAPPFSGPPLPPVRGGIPSGPSHSGGRGGGGGGTNRGGPSGRGGRGSSMNNNRGGMSNRGGGRGGSQSFGGNRGGSSVRGHGSRGNFGGNNRDHHNNNNNRRGGGSFSSGSGSGNLSHQGQSGNYRGRAHGGHGGNRMNGRSHDNSGTSFGSRDGTMGSSFNSGKKDENRRTLTDFKLIGLEIQELGWCWGTIPPKREDVGDDQTATSIKVDGVEEHAETTTSEEKASQDTSQPAIKVEESQEMNLSSSASQKPFSPKENVAPSRIRIYFHTPVSTDDSHPIPYTSYSGDMPSDTRKGKRKKIEDDDGDIEEGRAPPPPPQMAHSEDRSHSAAPSVMTEAVSEADWLMAAITEGEDGSETRAHDEDDEDQLHVSQIVDPDDDGYEATQPAHDDDESTLIVHDVDMTYEEHHEDADDKATGATSGDVAESSQEGHASELPNGTDASASVNGDGPDGQILANSEAASAPAEEGPDITVSVSAAITLPPKYTEHTTDTARSDDTQVQEVPTVKHNGISETPTLLDIMAQDSKSLVESASTLDASAITLVAESTSSKEDSANGEHLPEPPASPFVSNSSASNHGDAVSKPVVNLTAKANTTPSANRLSVSYASGSRRLVIDAEVVHSLKVFRKEGRIEVSLTVAQNEGEGEGGLRGFLIEKLSDITKSYHTLQTLSDGYETDPTVPPFSKLNPPQPLTLLVYLDTERPLSEPKWVKSGDVQDWLKAMFGRMFWVAGDAADGWEKKIEVVDPDPPPTIWTVLEGWAANSPVGLPNERQRFLKTHLGETDNILEILLRLVRGERATPFLQSAPTVAAPNVSGPLLNALSPGSAHGSQQTHVSLAVLATFRMAVEYAKKADGDSGKAEAEERMGEIIRCLPTHLLYKSLDGIFKEWKVEKKGR